MSKEEFNKEISNSQPENATTDSSFNTQQIIKPDFIQETSESNQFSDENDRKVNSESPCGNKDSNLISEELKNVNKQEDSGSTNEKSAVDINESISPSSANGQSLLQSDTELQKSRDTGLFESETTVSNQSSKGLESTSEILGKSDGQIAKENLDIQEDTVSENTNSHPDAENGRSNSEKGNNGEITEKTVVDICKNSGPYFQKSQEFGENSDEKIEQNDEGDVTESLKLHSEIKQDAPELSGDFKGDSTDVNESNSDIDTANKVSNVQEPNAGTEGAESETYEDDFEETTEIDKNNTTEVLDQENSNDKEHENGEKEDTEKRIIDKREEESTVGLDEKLQATVTDICSSDEVTSQNIDSNLNREEVNEDCDTSRNVNEDGEEKELTEIVIDEEGIPKIAVTTVPDRPPSSLASETEKADPFEDFQFDTENQTKNKIDMNGIEESNQSTDSKKETTSKDLHESDSLPDQVAMENSNNDEVNYNKQGSTDTSLQENGDTINKGENVEESISKEKKSDEVSRVENENTDKGGGISETIENERNDERSENTIDSQENKLSQDVNGTADDEKVRNEYPAPFEKTDVSKLEEKSQSPEPAPAPKQESPLEQMLKRNVTIDGTVDSVTQLESNVTTLLSSMKDVMKYYSDLLKLQALKDFTNDLGKFKGDFTSINEAFKKCNSMSLNINQHLKELRHTTEDVRTQIHRKFQQEDLNTWIDLPAEKEKEKERLQEETIAAEKAAMAKAAEARHAVATAINGVAEANQLIAEMETQAADAEAISQKAAAQARSALIAAEEARIAAEERKRAEDAAKKRAEERARIKAAEEEKKKALEEMKIHQNAAAKGTSVEDERRSFMEEKKRKELERKNPKNWPRFSYNTDGVDFTPSVGCIIRAIEGSMRKADISCSYVDQSKGVLTLTNTEELVSNIIEVKQVEEDRTFSFEEPLSVALPVCIGRLPSGKETMVKQLMPNGAWRELPSAEVQFEDYRELKFVEGRCNKFGTFVVVLRPKKDTLQFQKKGSKLLCSSDTRISFTNKPGAFKQNTNAVLEVQTLDSNVVPDLKMRSPKECGDLISASPFIKFSMHVKSFEKPLTVSLPLPQVQTKQKRPATGLSRETKSQELRPSTARPSSSTEDDTTEEIFFLHRDDKSCWTVDTKMHLVQPKSKDTVTFDMTEPYQRFILLRTKAGKSVAAVEKMATFLENVTTQRNVKVIARQRNDDVADVMIACTSSNRLERTLKYMGERSFTEGPSPSPDIVLQEGQQLYLKFRGNVECISENPSLSFIFNTNIRATREFKINEKEEFAQKSLPSFRGFVQVYTKALVPKPILEGAPKNVQPEMVEAEVLLTELLLELPKPEAEPPKPLATAPLNLKEGPLTNGVLRYIAGMLGKEWKDVAAQLNLKPMRIQAILRNHVNKDTAETRFDMLVTWAKRVPKAVDKVQILYNALIACGRPDIADEVRHRGQQYKQQRLMSARVSHLRQAFVKVAKTTSVFNRWKAFAKGIGVPEEQIQRIDESGGSGQEKCYTSLETWKDVVGEDATVSSLATYLKTANQDRLSRDVEALVAS